MDKSHPTRHAAAYLPVLHTREQWGNPWTDPKGLLHDSPNYFGLNDKLCPTLVIKHSWNDTDDAVLSIFNVNVKFIFFLYLDSTYGRLWFFFFALLICVFYVQVWMELLSQAPQQYVVAASCPWMGAWLCLMMQASHIPIDLNMLLEVKARSKVVYFIFIHIKTFIFSVSFVLEVGRSNFTVTGINMIHLNKRSAWHNLEWFSVSTSIFINGFMQIMPIPYHTSQCTLLWLLGYRLADNKSLTAMFCIFEPVELKP